MYKIIGGDQKEYGPVTADEMRQWIAEGRLSGQSLAQSESATDWKPLAAFAEFEPDLRAQAGLAAATRPSPPPLSPAARPAPTQSREPELNVGQCLARSWDLLSANFGLLIGATVLVWLVSLLEFVPVLGLAYLIVRGALFGGLYLVFLKRIRGEDAAPGEAFAGFSLAFAQLALAGVVVSVLTAIGRIFCVLPGIYLAVAWVFAVPLVADRRLEFWPAMQLSRRTASRVWFRLFGLLFIAFFPAILVTLFTEAKIFGLVVPFVNDVLIPFIKQSAASGSPDPAALSEAATNLSTQIAKLSVSFGLLTKCVLLLNLPFGLGALMYAYEDLFGPGPTPTA